MTRLEGRALPLCRSCGTWSLVLFPGASVPGFLLPPRAAGVILDQSLTLLWVEQGFGPALSFIN
jgi:hypothetical protein